MKTFHHSNWIAQVVQDAEPGEAKAAGTAYDSVWSHQGMPVQEPSAVEALLLKEDKLYTVLAIVLVIWFGIMAFMLRTDRKLDRLENAERSGKS